MQASSLLLVTSIGYGPTHVSCECRDFVAIVFGGGHLMFKVRKSSFGVLECTRADFELWRCTRTHLELWSAQGLIWSRGGAQEVI